MAADGLVIDFERDRRRPGILAALQCIARVQIARACNSVCISALAKPALRRLDLDQLFLFQGCQKLVCNTCKRKANFLCNLKAGQIAPGIEQLKYQVL